MTSVNFGWFESVVICESEHVCCCWLLVSMFCYILDWWSTAHVLFITFSISFCNNTVNWSSVQSFSLFHISVILSSHWITSGTFQMSRSEQGLGGTVHFVLAVRYGDLILAHAEACFCYSPPNVRQICPPVKSLGPTKFFSTTMRVDPESLKTPTLTLFTKPGTNCRLPLAPCAVLSSATVNGTLWPQYSFTLSWNCLHRSNFWID